MVNAACNGCVNRPRKARNETQSTHNPIDLAAKRRRDALNRTKRSTIAAAGLHTLATASALLRPGRGPVSNNYLNSLRLFQCFCLKREMAMLEQVLRLSAAPERRRSTARAPRPDRVPVRGAPRAGPGPGKYLLYYECCLIWTLSLQTLIRLRIRSEWHARLNCSAYQYTIYGSLSLSAHACSVGRSSYVSNNTKSSRVCR